MENQNNETKSCPELPPMHEKGQNKLANPSDDQREHQYPSGDELPGQPHIASNDGAHA